MIRDKWRRTTVTVGDQAADAFVCFADRGRAASPVVLEWPEKLAPGTAVRIGDDVRFAGPCEACAQQFHIRVLAEPKEVKP